MATIDPLPSSKLHATYDPALIPADDSTGIRPAPMEGRTPIQDRAMKALDVALNIRSCGFNVYLAGDSYLGRQYMLTQYLRPVARKAATPPDLVYVYNFQTPDSPALISLPAGQGRRFRQAMEECVRDIDRDMDRRLAGQRFSKQREKLLTDYQVERTQLIHRMNNVAEHKGFSLDIDESGNMTLYPLVKGRRVSQDDFESLDAGIRIALKHRGEAVAQHMSGLVHALTKMEEGYVDQEKVLEKAAMSAVLDAVLEPLRKRMEKITDSAALSRFFQDLREDILKNTDSFIGRQADPQPQTDGRQDPGQPQPARDTVRSRYRVNVFVDNAETKGAPIVIEDHPTTANLLGCIERESELGTLVTDFTLIKSGSIHCANGGSCTWTISCSTRLPGRASCAPSRPAPRGSRTTPTSRTRPCAPRA